MQLMQIVFKAINHQAMLEQLTLVPEILKNPYLIFLQKNAPKDFWGHLKLSLIFQTNLELGELI